MAGHITVDTNRCPQNHPCPAVQVCPVGALRQVEIHAPTVDLDKCTGCGKCIHFCPMGAFQVDG